VVSTRQPADVGPAGRREDGLVRVILRIRPADRGRIGPGPQPEAGPTSPTRGASRGEGRDDRRPGACSAQRNSSSRRLAAPASKSVSTPTAIIV
jgi:hypothetical protein